MSVDRSDLALLARSVGTRVREVLVPIVLRITKLEEQASALGSAERIVEQQNRIVELEQQLARLSGSVDAHRRHLSNLEMKLGNLIRGGSK